MHVQAEEESAVDLQDEINKRLTLNLLIQGSAQHAFLTSHYLVRDELNAIDPGLLLLYDRFALAAFIQYWRGASVLISGGPKPFWKRAARSRWHPFHKFPLLAKHGGTLAEEARKRALVRCKEKGVWLLPVTFSFQLIYLLNRLSFKEIRHLPALVALAKRVTSMIWGVSEDQLDGSITRRVAFGDLSLPRSFKGAVLRASAAGYGGVLRHEWNPEKFKVVGKAWNWPILSHELNKGTAELICMHGLSDLSDDVYKKVMRAADRIEYEPWMLQTGCELWRLLLTLLPEGVSLSHMLMHIARLPARSLEALMMAVIENPDWARELLAAIGEGARQPVMVSGDDDNAALDGDGNWGG